MKEKKSRPILFKPFCRSALDILIPFHAQYERVHALVKSILYSVKSNPYQITLIDDCSENKNFGEEIKKQFSREAPSGFKPILQYIRSEQQLGFGGALKLGFDSTNSPWVLFMHSDCLVEDANFMIHMGQSLLNWRRNGVPVKIVSARSNNPGDCSSAKAEAKDKGTNDIVLGEETLPLFCAMCNRDLFGTIGGFLKAYPYAWYEDEELVHRMRSKGLLQGVCARAWVRHQGAATIKYMWNRKPETREIMESNRERCLADIRAVGKK
jgi:GT2 family glycosyltransferase